MLLVLLSLLSIAQTVPSVPPPMPIEQYAGDTVLGTSNLPAGFSCLVFDRVVSKDQSELPIREGSPAQFGVRHFMKDQPKAYNPQLIQDALSNGVCQKISGTHYSCHHKNFTVVYDESLNDRCPDGLPLGVLTAYFDKKWR